MENKYWEFKNKTSQEADLYLYSEIASWGGGFMAHSAQSFKDDLDALGEINTLNIYINCPGGDVFEGVAIANMLKRKNCVKNVYIDGLAASIASVIAMAGDNIYMPTNAMMMIHNASVGCFGTAKELREAADLADKVTKSVRQTYVDKTKGKLNEETIENMMNNETWLSAQECLDYGFCTEITASVQAAACIDAKYKNIYKKTPESLLLKQLDNVTNCKKPDDKNTDKIAAINHAIKHTDLFIALG